MNTRPKDEALVLYLKRRLKRLRGLLTEAREMQKAGKLTTNVAIEKIHCMRNVLFAVGRFEFRRHGGRVGRGCRNPMREFVKPKTDALTRGRNW